MAWMVMIVRAQSCAIQPSWLKTHLVPLSPVRVLCAPARAEVIRMRRQPTATAATAPAEAIGATAVAVAVVHRADGHDAGGFRPCAAEGKQCSSTGASGRGASPKLRKRLAEGLQNGPVAMLRQISGESAAASDERFQMFSHMLQGSKVVDLRRRALTLIDVVTESSRERSPFLRLFTAFVISIIYWKMLTRSFTGRFAEASSEEEEPLRPGGPWAQVQVSTAMAWTTGYLLAAFFGVRFMNQRAPVQKNLFEYMLIYNASQAMLNAFLGFSLWTEAWTLGFPYPWGNGLDNSPAGHRLGMLLYVQYHFRQLELLDTLFIVLRKKFQQTSMLQIFLRLVHMWGWFFVCRYACGGDSYFPAAVNCTCQVIVYSYYALSMISKHGVPLIRRARVTEVQVLQFVVCATHASYVLVHGNLPRAVGALSFSVMMTGLYLYVEWEGHHPHFGPRTKLTRNMSMFGHMFERSESLVDLRRRALGLIDVVSERDENGPLRPHRLLTAFAVSLVYWYYVLPALLHWGTRRWYREGRSFPRAGGPWAEVHWVSAIVVSMGYLFVVLAGMRLMERRPPIQKRVFEYMFIYNATQVMLNASLGFTLWKEAWDLSFHLWGNTLDTSHAGHRLGMLLWFQYHCRQLELLDTMFIILRKKFHHMSFLHIFLRLAHMWGWFFACRFACGGDSYFPAAVNCTCQVIVYLYYAMSLIDGQGVPLMRRARVTEVQVFQFVICAVHATYVIYHGNLPRAVAGVSLFVMCSSLLLYVDFASDHPRLGPKRHSDEDAVKERLTFRFDSSGWFFVYHFGVALWIEEHLIPEGLTAEDAASDRYPKALAFSGSSGGSLAAGALATGIPIRSLFEFVLRQHSQCRRSPLRMFSAVEDAMKLFLPKNAATSMTGRVRVLLTRISYKPPFITGEVVDQFKDQEDVYHGLRASCHVPIMNPLPYRYHGRYYFDGLIWSSLLVPWSGENANLVVKCSATSAPLTDIRSPFNPLWWVILPPSIDVLRGLFWVGYRDAAQWFAAPPSDPLDCCKCTTRCGPGRAPSAAVDPLSYSRSEKYEMAQKLLLRKPKLLEHALPKKDPTTGQDVATLIANYKRASERNLHVALWGMVAMSAVVVSVFVKLGVPEFL